jgi:type III secretory pathway component EscR
VKSSPWVDAIQNALSLVLVGLAFRYSFDSAIALSLPENLLKTIKYGVTIGLLVLSVFIAIDLVKALVRIGRRRLAK